MNADSGWRPATNGSLRWIISSEEHHRGCCRGRLIAAASFAFHIILPATGGTNGNFLGFPDKFGKRAALNGGAVATGGILRSSAVIDRQSEFWRIPLLPHRALDVTQDDISNSSACCPLHSGAFRKGRPAVSTGFVC